METIKVETPDAEMTGRNGTFKCVKLVLFDWGDTIDIYSENSKGNISHGGFFNVPEASFMELCKQFMESRKNETPSVQTNT